MKPLQIKARLQMAGYRTLGDLADELGVSRTIHGRLTSRALMEAIAARIKRAPHKGFPSYAHLWATPKATRINRKAQSS